MNVTHTVTNHKACGTVAIRGEKLPHSHLNLHTSNFCTIESCTWQMKPKIGFLSLSFFLFFFFCAMHHSSKKTDLKAPSCMRCPYLHIFTLCGYLSSYPELKIYSKKLHLFCFILHRGSYTVSPQSSKGESVT